MADEPTNRPADDSESDGAERAHHNPAEQLVATATTGVGTDSTEPLWRQLVTDRWGDGRVASFAGYAVLAVAIGLGAFQIYAAITQRIAALPMRAIHLCFILVLVFAIRPVNRRPWARHPVFAVLDLALVVAAVTICVYPVVYYDEIAGRMGRPSDSDILLGVLAILLVLEACRRVIGWFMAILVSAFLFYAWIGPLLPGLLWHRGSTYQRISSYTYLSLDGIFGLPLGVAATFVFIFIFFGAVLQKSGGGSFFIDLAYTLTGRYRGGPAKGAVTASAFMGSISGSAIANTVTTGAFTIPMMKRVGYRAQDAGGVEAAASTGGQLLPPIMGAGAFVMAELLGVPYVEIVKVAVIPALMYFVVIFLFVDILARKYGLFGIPSAELPRIRAVLARGFHFLIPLALLIYLLVEHVTPMRAGLYATGAMFVVAMLRSSSRMNLRDIAEIFVLAARNTLTVSVATAAAGIIVGVVGLTGLGLKFSSLILDVGGGYLLPTLLMVAIASLILGLGLPVTASYIVLITLAAPALGELGLIPIVAHMIVYWYSQDSNVTPPVALAAFAASGIAGASPMRTGVAAWKFAKGLYIIPLMMAYSPLLLNGSPIDIIFAVLSGLLGLMAFATAIEGYWLRKTTWSERIAMTVATVLLVAPLQIGGIIGAVLVAGVVVNQIRTRPREVVPAV